MVEEATVVIEVAVVVMGEGTVFVEEGAAAMVIRAAVVVGQTVAVVEEGTAVVAANAVVEESIIVSYEGVEAGNGATVVVGRVTVEVRTLNLFQFIVGA